MIGEKIAQESKHNDIQALTAAVATPQCSEITG